MRPRTGGMPVRPFAPGAAHQMEQHGLQIVVRIVRHRDFGSVRGMLQPCIANTPRGLLHRGIACGSGYVHALDRQFHAELLTQPAAEGFVPVGLAPRRQWLR